MEKIQQAIERARQQRQATPPQRPPRSGQPSARLSSAAAFGLDEVRVVRPPIAHIRRHRLVAASGDDALSDVIRKLRTQTVLRLQALNARSLAIVSARDGEGKTLVACNLALAIAHQMAAPTFLVDMDFRRPSVHEVFGIDDGASLSDVIVGTVAPADAVVRYQDTSLYVVPQRRKQPDASELVGAARASAVLQELLAVSPDAKLVVDCPPLLLTDEPLMVQRYVDGCLLVVEQGRTTRQDVERATECLDETKYLGSVLNRVADNEAETYYGYR